MAEDIVEVEPDDWEIVQRLLPAGWQEKARQLGALRRTREFPDAQTLLRVMFIHLAEGCSLRETAVRAAQGGLVAVSAVALFKRLRVCGEWFRWMAEEMMGQWVSPAGARLWHTGLNVRVVDGTQVSEPGATGSTWRVHYSALLPSLHCDEVLVTDPSVGESLSRFSVRPGDVLIADRGYAHRAGVRHVVAAGGAVVVRINLTNLPLLERNGRAFPLLRRLRSLSCARLGDWPALVADEQGVIAGRLCAIKKSRAAAKRARDKAQREARHKGHQIRPETLAAAGYTFVFTTLEAKFPAPTVLEMYRGRWQVELAFKRLKSLLALGHLKKIDPEGAKAWLQGKLLVATLIEAMIGAAERFSPWGYPVQALNCAQPLARDFVHAPSV
jgi:hypothetical protein